MHCPQLLSDFNLANEPDVLEKLEEQTLVQIAIDLLVPCADVIGAYCPSLIGRPL
jgi:hypothetical protein